MPARLAQLDKRQSAEREAACSNPGWTKVQGLKNKWGEFTALAAVTSTRGLDIPDFSNKDEQP